MPGHGAESPERSAHGDGRILPPLFRERNFRIFARRAREIFRAIFYIRAHLRQDGPGGGGVRTIARGIQEDPVGQ